MLDTISEREMISTVVVVTVVAVAAVLVITIEGCRSMEQ